MTRLALLIPALVAVALAMGGQIHAADAKPVPATEPKVEAQTVSAAVSAGLAKIRMRVDAAKGTDGKVSAAGVADALARVVKLDDAVESAADMAAILASAKELGLVPATVADYAAMLAIAKGGGGAAVAPAPVVAVPTPTAPPKVEAPAAPEMVWQVGAKVRLFALPVGTKWVAVNSPNLPMIPADLPAIATLRAPGVPESVPTWVKRPTINTPVPNRLVEATGLDDQTYTATEISGAYYAEEDGPLSIVVESNGPVGVEFSGKPVLMSTWSPPLDQWVSKGYSLPNMISTADGKVSAITNGFTPALKTGRYYPVRILVYQSWRRTAKNDANVAWSESMRHSPEADAAGRALEVQGIGSKFRLRIVRPERSEPEAMRLYTQQPKRVLKDE